MKHFRYDGLDELRAIAALIIIPGHIEQTKEIFGITPYHWLPIPGKLGVVLFFVLSGFLITTLLFKEKERNKNINLRKFYLRRILRIWPLYFLIMCLSVLVFNQIHVLQVPVYSERLYSSIDTTSIVLMALILPNFLLFIVPYAGHLWSIGIEEQFYLFQPFLIKYLKDYRLQIAILLIIVFSTELVNYFIEGFDSKYYRKVVSQFYYFGCIAIGSLSAVLYLNQRKLVELVAYNRYVQASAYLLFLVFLFIIQKESNEWVIDFRIHSIIFAILILNIATNPHNIIKIKNKTLGYLGKISYGIYMYHPICIGLAIVIARHIIDISEDGIYLNALIYFFSLTFTLFISAASFKYFEGYFLDLKKRYDV